MRRAEVILGAYAMDCVCGDPEWFPHPVRGMGAAIVWGERWLRGEGQTAGQEMAAGAVLVAAVVGASYAVTAGLIRLGYGLGARWGAGMELVLGWTCLAGRSLGVEAGLVLEAVERGDLERARSRVARIVGRDTAGLGEGEVCRAVVETVAESLSDGVMAPLLWMAVGGVPMAMAYKAVNTLDSMIGHADARYWSFGKVAARLDDVANLLPSRLTAAGIVGAAALAPWGSAGAAARVWWRDAGAHRSPNAGQPEAAMAGALGVRLGGWNTYEGELVMAARMGGEFGGADVAAGWRAVWIAGAVGFAGMLVGAMVSARRGR